MNTNLYEYLSKLNTDQLKIFYGAFVYFWANNKCFISKQNFFNLWCEINYCCHDLDDSFPDPYDNHELLKAFCHAHPYYFINILPADLIARLFAEHVDDRVDILAGIVKKIYEEDITDVYKYANEVLGLDKPVDILVKEAQDHIKYFS